MKTVFPEYDNCGVNVVSSIVQYFGMEPRHQSHPYVDRLLQGICYRNIVLFLFDGMGMEVMRNNLPEDSFLRQHIVHELSAVYPSTTTAATTAIETEYMPGEHGWIGWTLYFKELDKRVDIFLNRDAETKEVAADYDVVGRYLPIEPVFDRINRSGKARAACISAYVEPPYKTLPEIAQAIRLGCEEPGQHYFYGYWGDPDHQLHESGVDSPAVKKVLNELDEWFRAFCSALPEDTLVMATADHGQLNIEFLYVTDHPKLCEALLRPTSVEPRTTAFYVKPEYMQVFPALFPEAFPEGFQLMTSREFLDSGILGPGQMNPRIPELVGDYVAIATDRFCIDYTRTDKKMVGAHAGMTVAEMRVPLIVAKA